MPFYSYSNILFACNGDELQFKIQTVLFFSLTDSLPHVHTNQQLLAFSFHFLIEHVWKYFFISFVSCESLRNKYE